MNNIARLDRAHVLHPWTHFDSHEREGCVVVSRGEGCDVWDANGRRYLDAVGGMWCTNVGLGRADMAQTISDQVLKLAYSSTFGDITNDPSALLAAELAAIAPGDLNRVHLTTGGSTAVDSAYRMAQAVQYLRGHKDRRHVIARQDSYHGSTFLCMSIGRRTGDQPPEFNYKTDEIHHVSSPYLYHRPEGMTEQAFEDQLVAEFAAKVEEVGPEKIAAFFAEPIQASGGVLVPTQNYLKRLWEICQQHGILFIADEVVTSFGRLGAWFASESVYGFVPDMITTAKGLSSGYLPIGALIFSDRIYNDLSGDRYYASGYTYSGHPVSSAAALKNIQIIRAENMLERAQKAGARFQAMLQGLSDLPIVGDARGHTLIGCIENVADKATRRHFADEINIGKRVSNAAEPLGLLVRPLGHLNVMSPALIITDDQIGFIGETLRKAITTVTDQLVREGVKIGT